MFLVFGFYKFRKISSPNKMRDFFQKIIAQSNVRGTVILSTEGINGTLSGKKTDINFIKNLLKKKIGFIEFDSKNESYTKFQPFHRAKVKVKKEVVPLGFKITNKNKNNDNYLSFNSWNNLIKNKKTIVIDVRKPFEYHIGTFKNAINPKIKNFRDFPRFLKKVAKNKPVAMFCTGGIRCEKASAYLSKKGFKNTFQLKGGVLNYLKNIKKKESLWNGECFVFDNRISVKHKLRQGTYSMCSGCRTPVSTKDKKSQKYEEGVSCPNCHDKLTNSQKMRFRMRQKQINLAKKLGTKHIFQKEFY